MNAHELYIPITEIKKSVDGPNEGQWYVKGFASTPDKDTQNDIVNPSGINIDYFKKHGFINYEHQAEVRIGVPTECYIDTQKGLYLEAVLFKDNPYAQKLWNLAEDIKKSGLTRNLGFSVEGRAKRGSGSRTDVLEELVVTNVALTAQPANPNATWESFVKSINELHEEADKQHEESVSVLANSLVTLSDLYKADNDKVTDKVEEALKHLMEYERDTGEIDILALQIAKGMSRKEAEEIVKAFREELK